MNTTQNVRDVNNSSSVVTTQNIKGNNHSRDVITTQNVAENNHSRYGNASQNSHDLMSVTKRNQRYRVRSHANGITKQPNKQPVYADTVARVKRYHYLPTYVAKVSGWTKGSGEGYWYTICPVCQPGETRKGKHKFWLNRACCGCFNPKCKLNERGVNTKHDVISLHAILSGMTLVDAIDDLAYSM